MIKDYKEKIKLIESISKKLNSQSIDRLIKLIEIDDNWDNYESSQIKLLSLNNMIDFLSNKTIPEKIGYFFDTEGYMILNWLIEDKTIEIQFKNKSTLFYMSGYDDYIYLTKSIVKNMDLNNPENLILPIKEKLKIISLLENKLTEKSLESLLSAISYSDGWGEHGEEKEVQMDAIISCYKLFSNLDEIEDEIIFFPTYKGDLEAILNFNDRKGHEMEFTSWGVEFFPYPFDVVIEANREDFPKYKTINDFLKGDITMKKMIENMKKFVTTNKPSKNIYGNKIQAIYLADHVLYALLRKKPDYKSCSQKPNDAKIKADNFLSMLVQFEKLPEERKKGHHINHYFKERLGVDLNDEIVIELSNLIKEQIV